MSFWDPGGLLPVILDNSSPDRPVPYFAIRQLYGSIIFQKTTTVCGFKKMVKRADGKDFKYGHCLADK